jgi:hypothetical protein
MTVSVPAWLHRRVKEQAAAQGRSVEQLVLSGVTAILLERKRPRAERVRFPLIVSNGQRLDSAADRSMDTLNFPDATIFQLPAGRLWPAAAREAETRWSAG